MIEKIVLDYLVANGPTENVYMEVPVNPPGQYIVLEKTGSAREDKIDRAQMAIQSYSANSLLEAATLNEAVKECLEDMADNEDAIFAARLNSDYNYTNTASKEYRYQAVFDFYY